MCMDNHIQVKLISLEDIYKTKCFDLKQIIQIIEDALLAYSNNEILLPDKISQIFNEGLQTRINCMPSTLLKEGVCGVKWVSVFPNNPKLYNKQNVVELYYYLKLKQVFHLRL